MHNAFDSSSIEITLKETADLLVRQGKGILAVDESPSSIVNRFQAINVDNVPEQRRVFRQLLFSTPNIQHYISGVILHEETFNQSNDSSILFPIVLKELGILPGIRLDKVVIEDLNKIKRIAELFNVLKKGLESLTIHTNETITLGFDDLEKRCEYL